MTLDYLIKWSTKEIRMLSCFDSSHAVLFIAHVNVSAVPSLFQFNWFLYFSFLEITFSLDLRCEILITNEDFILSAIDFSFFSCFF